MALNNCRNRLLINSNKLPQQAPILPYNQALAVLVDLQLHQLTQVRFDFVFFYGVRRMYPPLGCCLAQKYSHDRCSVILASMLCRMLGTYVVHWPMYFPVGERKSSKPLRSTQSQWVGGCGGGWEVGVGVVGWVELGLLWLFGGGGLWLGDHCSSC